MRTTELMDHVVDLTSVLDGIGCEWYGHIWVLTRGMDMDMPVVEYRLEDPRYLGIHLLDSVDTTLTHGTRECWYLVDPDDTLVGDDEYIELIIDPREKYKREKKYPVEWHKSPEDPTPNKAHNLLAYHDDKDGWYDEKYNIENLKYKNNPMTMENHHYMFRVLEEWDMLFLDHVIWGGLK
jgi:hypothetical protein